MSAGPMNAGQGFNWSDPAYDQGGFHKWQNEGDTISGVVREIGSHTFEARGVVGSNDYQAAQTYPVLYLQTDRGEKELTVSSIDLLEKTKRANPQVGDTYTAHWVATAGKKRIFTVTVTRVAPVIMAHPAPTREDTYMHSGTDTGPMPGANPNNPVQAQMAAAAQNEEAPF